MRPEAVRIAPSGGGGHLSGVVKKAAYLGRHMEYEIALHAPAVDVLVFDSNVRTPFDVGRVLSVEIDPQGAAVVPHD